MGEKEWQTSLECHCRQILFYMVYSYGPSTGPYFPDKKPTKNFCLGKPTTIIEREKLNQQAAIYFREKTTGDLHEEMKGRRK